MAATELGRNFPNEPIQKIVNEIHIFPHEYPTDRFKEKLSDWFSLLIQYPNRNIEIFIVASETEEDKKRGSRRMVLVTAGILRKQLYLPKKERDEVFSGYLRIARKAEEVIFLHKSHARRVDLEQEGLERRKRKKIIPSDDSFRKCNLPKGVIDFINGLEEPGGE